uniref:Mediator of RNA polymerase II transcription subunit 28 n=1 Tax=Oncorhynchus tshawytscha TaxID=74940 RepID=A0AAZ3R973_ONCTS
YEPVRPNLKCHQPGLQAYFASHVLLAFQDTTFVLCQQACFASLVSQDYVNGTDQEEIRTGVDQCIQKFLDVARQTECFFLQKRLQLSVQKPDQVVKEDVSELRNELQRKELLVQKHLSKLHHWQQVLEDVSVQHRKPSDLPPPGPLAFLEQASASLPAAPLKQT